KPGAKVSHRPSLKKDTTPSSRAAIARASSTVGRSSATISRSAMRAGTGRESGAAVGIRASIPRGGSNPGEFALAWAMPQPAPRERVDRAARLQSPRWRPTLSPPPIEDSRDGNAWRAPHPRPAPGGVGAAQRPRDPEDLYSRLRDHREGLRHRVHRQG